MVIVRDARAAELNVRIGNSRPVVELPGGRRASRIGLGVIDAEADRRAGMPVIADCGEEICEIVGGVGGLA